MLRLGGVGADAPARRARVHTGTVRRGLARAKGEDGAAYEMPDWAGKKC